MYFLAIFFRYLCKQPKEIHGVGKKLWKSICTQWTLRHIVHNAFQLTESVADPRSSRKLFHRSCKIGLVAKFISPVFNQFAKMKSNIFQLLHSKVTLCFNQWYQYPSKLKQTECFPWLGNKCLRLRCYFGSAMWTAAWNCVSAQTDVSSKASH